jgi:hypothetical protein
MSDRAAPGEPSLPKPDRVLVEKVRNRANVVTWGACAAGRVSESCGVDMPCYALRGMAGGPPDDLVRRGSRRPPPWQRRGAVKLAPLRPHSGGERAPVKLGALRRRRRGGHGQPEVTRRPLPGAWAAARVPPCICTTRHATVQGYLGHDLRSALDDGQLALGPWPGSWRPVCAARWHRRRPSRCMPAPCSCSGRASCSSATSLPLGVTPDAS